MSSTSVSKDTPYFLIKEHSTTHEHFINLTFKLSNTTNLSRKYLLQKVLKKQNPKTKTGPRLEGYIRDMRLSERMTQFYIAVNSVQNVTYLAAKYFTLGLIQVEEDTKHIIHNQAKNGTIFVYRCSPQYKEKYIWYANSNKALYDKIPIIRDFDPLLVEPGKYCIMEPDSIYFFYSVTHCRCTLIRVSEGDSSAEVDPRYSLSRVDEGTGLSPSSRWSIIKAKNLGNKSIVSGFKQKLENELERRKSRGTSIKDGQQELQKAPVVQERSSLKVKVAQIKQEVDSDLEVSILESQKDGRYVSNQQNHDSSQVTSSEDTRQSIDRTEDLENKVKRLISSVRHMEKRKRELEDALDKSENTISFLKKSRMKSIKLYNERLKEMTEKLERLEKNRSDLYNENLKLKQMIKRQALSRQ